MWLASEEAWEFIASPGYDLFVVNLLTFLSLFRLLYSARPGGL